MKKLLLVLFLYLISAHSFGAVWSAPVMDYETEFKAGEQPPFDSSYFYGAASDSNCVPGAYHRFYVLAKLSGNKRKISFFTQRCL